MYLFFTISQGYQMADRVHIFNEFSLLMDFHPNSL